MVCRTCAPVGSITAILGTVVYPCPALRTLIEVTFPLVITAWRFALIALSPRGSST